MVAVSVETGTELDLTARNIPNLHSPAPNPNRINNIVGTSLRDLINPEKPNLINPLGLTIPCQIDSNQEGRVS